MGAKIVVKTGAREVKRRASTKRREEVISAAARVFYRLGYRAASINDIAHLDMLTTVLTDASADGGLAIPHPKMTALALMGMCNWILRWYREDGPMTPDQVADCFFELVYNGMKPRR
jgi:hypothetical protein